MFSEVLSFYVDFDLDNYSFKFLIKDNNNFWDPTNVGIFYGTSCFQKDST